MIRDRTCEDVNAFLCFRMARGGGGLRRTCAVRLGSHGGRAGNEGRDQHKHHAHGEKLRARVSATNLLTSGYVRASVAVSRRANRELAHASKAALAHSSAS